MNKTTWVAATLILAPFTGTVQNLRPATSGNQLQLSIQNGLSSFMTNASRDSVYFLKAGYTAGVQGNYYWNNFGVAGRIGYFANAADKQALEDFARSRRAPRDRMQLTTESFRGLYVFTGPSFQSTFNKWRIQSSLEGGLISKPSSQVFIGDNASPDIVYYRNVFEEKNSFAWSAGLSVSYSISRQFLLGVNADYLNTKNEVVNYDMQRGNGHEAKNIASQAGFLNTGLRLSYLFNQRSSREAGSGIATGKRNKELISDENSNGLLNSNVSNSGKSAEQQNDTCRCEEKVMDVKELTPYIVEIRFATVSAAKEFLDTYEPLLQRRDVSTGQSTGRRQHMSSAQSNPLYQETGNKGTNPLYESKSDLRTTSNAPGLKGVVRTNAKGAQEFYLFPSVVDLAEVLAVEDGRVTIHVENPVFALREAGSGMATGRRTHNPAAPDDDNNGSTMKAGVSTSRSNIPRASRMAASDDSTDNPNMMKAGISTSRSNVRSTRLMSSSEGSTVIECEIELNGRVYSAIITARHDTAKNSIGNIR